MVYDSGSKTRLDDLMIALSTGYGLELVRSWSFLGRALIPCEKQEEQEEQTLLLEATVIHMFSCYIPLKRSDTMHRIRVEIIVSVALVALTCSNCAADTFCGSTLK